MIKQIVKIAFLAVLLYSTAGLTDDLVKPGTKVINEPADGVDDGTQPGWHPMLKLSANFSLGQSKNVPGNADGLSYQFGYVVNSGLDFLSNNKQHEWTNALLWELGFTQTPVVDALVKSVDNIDFKSSYLYHIPPVPWLGPFASFRLTTSMLRAWEVRADPNNVYKLDPAQEQQFSDTGDPVDENGNVIDENHPSVEQFDAAQKIELTKPFAPLTLRESVGVFAVPVDKKEFSLDMRAGFGAWETFVQGGYFVEDNEDTENLLELRQMQDSIQAGPELGIIIKGLLDDKLTYNLSALFMQPVVHNADTELEGIDLLNAEFDARIGLILWKIISLDYSFKAYMQPLIIDKWQIQNSLLLSVNFELIG